MTEEHTDKLDIKFQQRFSLNLITNIIYFILQFIVGIALVPFFIDTLGPATYGLIPLATSVTSYVNIVLNAMTGAVGRFLSIDLQRGDRELANETYNSALFGMLGILLIVIPIGILVASFVPTFFNIGAESQTDVFWLFIFIIGSALIRGIGAPRLSIFTAYNRIDYNNYVNFTNVIT